MATMATGYEIVTFFGSKWPEHYYIDDSEITVDEDRLYMESDTERQNPLPLEDKYDVAKFGFLCGNEEQGIPSLSTFFRRWKEKNETETIVLIVKKERVVTVREALGQLPGVKIK